MPACLNTMPKSDEEVQVVQVFGPEIKHKMSAIKGYHDDEHVWEVLSSR